MSYQCKVAALHHTIYILSIWTNSISFTVWSIISCLECTKLHRWRFQDYHRVQAWDLKARQRNLKAVHRMRSLKNFDSPRWRMTFNAVALSYSQRLSSADFLFGFDPDRSQDCSASCQQSKACNLWCSNSSTAVLSNHGLVDAVDSVPCSLSDATCTHSKHCPRTICCRVTFVEKVCSQTKLCLVWHYRIE